MSRIESIEALDAIYGTTSESATAKVTGSLTPEYRRLIQASPFAALATAGPEGLDCSPRGDRGTVVHIADDRTLWLPDRRGNNRIDTLRNIVRDPRVALLFLIPGSGTTMRVNGVAEIRTDAAMLEALSVEGQAPRCVIVVRIEQVYFQCARAVVRADLWNPAAQIDPKTLPTPGEILAALTGGQVGGKSYDDAWPARAAASMW